VVLDDVERLGEVGDDDDFLVGSATKFSEQGSEDGQLACKSEKELHIRQTERKTGIGGGRTGKSKVVRVDVLREKPKHLIVDDLTSLVLDGRDSLESCLFCRRKEGTNRCCFLKKKSGGVDKLAKSREKAELLLLAMALEESADSGAGDDLAVEGDLELGWNDEDRIVN
jgi:hypothetical protein